MCLVAVNPEWFHWGREITNSLYFSVDRQDEKYNLRENVLFWVLVAFKVIVYFRIDLKERELELLVISM